MLGEQMKCSRTPFHEQLLVLIHCIAGELSVEFRFQPEPQCADVKQIEMPLLIKLFFLLNRVGEPSKRNLRKRKAISNVLLFCAAVHWSTALEVLPAVFSSEFFFLMLIGNGLDSKALFPTLPGYNA